jgi:peptide/nickel transport system permease protein
MTSVVPDTTSPIAAPPPTRQRLLAAVRRNRPLTAGVGLLLLLILAMSVGPVLSPYNASNIDLRAALQSPNPAHWLGTDNLGRDVLTRIVAAARLDLQIAVICVILPFGVGSLVGAISGYIGGKVDAVLMRLVDMLWAFPFYVLVIAIVGTLGPGLANMYLAFTLVVWISFARIVRGEVLVLKRAEYVMAAQVLGFSHARIILRHVLPNAITPAIVFAMADVILTILAVTSLSFLGLGIQPPAAEWGLMIAEGRNFIFDAWWISTFPGIAIIFTGITFALLGDGIDDFLRPSG